MSIQKLLDWLVVELKKWEWKKLFFIIALTTSTSASEEKLKRKESLLTLFSIQFQIKPTQNCSESFIREFVSSTSLVSSTYL